MPPDSTGVTPLRIEVITLFPRMIEAPLAESILGKAQERGLLQVRARDLRPYGIGKHQITDDAPYGGGAGMVMKPEPLVAAIEDARAALGSTTRVILLDPQGTPFDQTAARRLSGESALVFVCGRYEGVDERVRAYVDETLSVGDFVLTGGEFATLCVIDAVARLRAGVLGNEVSSQTESFSEGLLEGPQYTRPLEFRGVKVPDILLSGDHAKVARWRHEQALARTQAVRPGLLERPPAQTTLKELPFRDHQCIGAPPEPVPRADASPQGSGAPTGSQAVVPGESRSDGERDAHQGD